MKTALLTSSSSWWLPAFLHRTPNSAFYNSKLHKSYFHLGFSTLNSVQSLRHIRLFVTPQTAACQASLSITNSWSLLKLMSIETVMLPNHLILCPALLLLPSIFPRIRVFSNESVLHIRWPKVLEFQLQHQSFQ